MPATVLQPEPVSPPAIHSCPSCSHWLADGTLACPDCETLTYGRHLSELAASAQMLENDGKWLEAKARWKSALAWLPENTQQAEAVQQHIAGIDGRLKAGEDQKARWKKRLGPFAPLALFLIKAKTYFLMALKFKFLLGLFSFFGIYWALFGWKFALGFTACLFIHELGHFVAVKRRGLKADLPVFLPGLGAYVRWYSQGVSRETLAAIALAGPVYGLAASLGCLGIALWLHSSLFMVLANVGAWVNFLNLLPILGLDGAQATLALSHLQRALVAATCVLFFCLTWGGELTSASNQWVFLIVGAGMAWKCFTNDAPEKPDTRTFAVFQALTIILGFVLYMTPTGGLH